MDKQDQLNMISKVMYNESTSIKFDENDWSRTVRPLYMLLAQLIDPQNVDTLIFGDIVGPDGTRVVALLVTDRNIYHAAFDLRYIPEEDPRGRTGWEVDGSYNLRIMPRSTITEITVNEIGTADRNMSDTVLRVNYEVHLGDFSFSFPLRRDNRDRNQHEEIKLLEALHNDLAQK